MLAFFFFLAVLIRYVLYSVALRDTRHGFFYLLRGGEVRGLSWVLMGSFVFQLFDICRLVSLECRLAIFLDDCFFLVSKLLVGINMGVFWGSFTASLVLLAFIAFLYLG